MSYNPSAGSGITGIGSAVGSGSSGGLLYVDANINLAQGGAPLNYASAQTYDPRNFVNGGTLVYWVDGNDTSKILDSGGSPVTNGSSIQTLKNFDSSTLATNAGGTKPTWSSSVQNSRGALVFANQILTFSGTSFLNGASQVTCGLVFIPTTVGSTNVLINSLSHNAAESRWEPFVNSSGKFQVQNSSIGTNQGSITSPTVLVAGSAYAVLMQWNVPYVLGWVRVGPTLNWQGATDSAAVAIENTDPSAAASFGHASASSNKILDNWCVTGSLMSDWQQLQWFQAVKSRFALTTY